MVGSTFSGLEASISSSVSEATVVSGTGCGMVESSALLAVVASAVVVSASGDVTGSSAGAGSAVVVVTAAVVVVNVVVVDGEMNCGPLSSSWGAPGTETTPLTAWDRCYDFKNIFAEKICEKIWRF
jgi:hypothetical protein